MYLTFRDGSQITTAFALSCFPDGIRRTDLLVVAQEVGCLAESLQAVAAEVVAETDQMSVSGNQAAVWRLVRRQRRVH